MSQFRVKPSKASSAVGLVVSLAFLALGIGVVMPMTSAAGQIPLMGPFIVVFGLLWTGMAAVIAVMCAINLFTERGIADTVVEVDHPPATRQATTGFDERLRKVEQLHRDGLRSDDEYNVKRSEILKERW
jgi:hypothetical protein